MKAAWIIAALAGLAFLSLAIVSPAAAAGGWLIAFVSIGAAPLGALAWMLIGRLTGGGWSRISSLRALAGCVPALFIAILPLFAAMGLIYPWSRTAGSALDFLSPLAWAGRSVAILAALGVIAVLSARAKSPLFAAVGLLVYGATVGPLAVDWVFSLRPGWISSAGGMALAVQQLGAAVAVLLVLGGGEQRQRRDLAALMIATVLGALYFDLIGYIVVWYGDQSDKTVFYRLRAEPVWIAVLVLSTVCRLATIGVVALHVRLGAAAFRIAGALVFLSVWLETVWMIAPATGRLSLFAGLLASVASAAGLFGWLTRRPDWSQGTVHV